MFGRGGFNEKDKREGERERERGGRGGGKSLKWIKEENKRSCIRNKTLATKSCSVILVLVVLASTVWCC